MHEDDAEVGSADGSRRLDIGLVADRKRLRLDQADIAWPPDEAQGDHCVQYAGPERADDRDRKNKTGNRQEHVGDAHDALAHPGLADPGNKPKRNADQHGDTGNRQSDVKGRAGTDDDAAVDVHADFVGPEPVGRIGRLQLAFEMDGSQRVFRKRNDPGSDGGDDQKYRNNRQPGHGGMGPAERRPHAPIFAKGVDRFEGLTACRFRQAHIWDLTRGSSRAYSRSIKRLTNMKQAPRTSVTAMIGSKSDETAALVA